MGRPNSFARAWVTWFLIGLAADAVLVGILWVMSRRGGLGEIREPWVVGAVLLVGTAWFATRRARRVLPARETPMIAVATTSAPAVRTPRPSAASAPPSTSPQGRTSRGTKGN